MCSLTDDQAHCRSKGDITRNQWKTSSETFNCLNGPIRGREVDLVGYPVGIQDDWREWKRLCQRLRPADEFFPKVNVAGNTYNSLYRECDMNRTFYVIEDQPILILKIIVVINFGIFKNCQDIDTMENINW